MTARPTSVIICTHNRADLLPGLVSQIRAQDYPRDAFEIVVVDNCSTDHTLQVVERLVAEPGVPVRYVREDRPGITFARNRGAEVGRFPYLTYIDDDCSADPDWLTQLLRGFDLHDDVEVVGGQVVLDWSQEVKPPWLSPELEPWLAANSYLGTQPRLLEKKMQIIECNMAITAEAWHAYGGFLGMEQFGSLHMAAGEVWYLLKQIERQRRKVAFIPTAVVHHHIGRRTRRWMLRRAFWQGVSDGLLDYLVYRRSSLSTACRLVLDTAAMIVLLGYTCFFYLMAGQPKSMYHLMRAIRRFGLILSKMHLVGDWSRVRAWASAHSSSN